MSLQGIIERVKNRNISLLYQIDVSDSEYNELIQYTRRKANDLYMQAMPTPDILLSVLLVQIAIREYRDGNYWDCFLEFIPDVSSSKRNYLGQIFMKTINDYNLFSIEGSNNSRNQYVENIKAHAFVPNNYLEGYFDFVFSFYERNLLRSIPENIEDDLEELQEYMKSTLSVSGDSIKLDSSDIRPAKSYKLLKATRNLIANISTEVLALLFTEHLCMIDGFYYDDVMPKRCERFSDAFYSWEKKINAELSENTNSIRKRLHVAFSHKPYFRIENDMLYLIIPEQKFRNDEFEDAAHLIINGIRKQRLDMFRAFGVIVSEVVKVPVENPFCEYKVKVAAISEKSYHIPAKKYRIFDEELNEIQRIKKGHCYVLVEKHINIKCEENDCIIYPDYSNVNWDKYALNVKDDTVIYIDNTPISLSGEFSGKPEFEFVSNEYYIVNNDGGGIQTAYKHPLVSFVVSKETYKGSFIWCNDERFNINIPQTTSIIELPGDEFQVGVTIRLENILLSHDGEYTIVLDEPNKAKKLITKYLLITNLRCRTDRRRYSFCSKAIISISKDYIVTPINCVISDEGTFILFLDKGDTSAIFNLKLNDVKYKLIIPINILRFSFSDNWIINKLDYIWYKDLKNELRVSLPGAQEAAIYLNRDESTAVEGKLQNGVFKFDITDIVNTINNSAAIWHYINISYFDNKKRNMTLFPILKKLWFERFELQKEGSDILIDAVYKGNGDCYVKIIDYDTRNVVIERRNILNGKTFFPELVTDKLYKIEKYMVENDKFGFGEDVTLLKKIYKFGFINYSDLTNCKIVINKIFDCEKELILNYDYTIRDLVKIDTNTYTGKITAKEKTKDKRAMEETVFPKVRIQIFDVENKKSYVSLFLEENFDWVDFWYDKNHKRLISAEDELLLSSTDYERFDYLYEDQTEFVVEYRRVK